MTDSELSRRSVTPRRVAVLIAEALGAIGGGVPTVMLLDSAKPQLPTLEAAVMFVGSVVCGSIGTSWMIRGAGAKYLAAYGLPTSPLLVGVVSIIGGVGFGMIWALGVFMLVRSVL